MALKWDIRATCNTDWDALRDMPDEEIVYDDDAPRADVSAFRNARLTLNGTPITPRQVPDAVRQRRAEEAARNTPAEAEIVPPDVRDWFVRHTENGDWKAGVREALRRHVEQAAL